MSPLVLFPAVQAVVTRLRTLTPRPRCALFVGPAVVADALRDCDYWIFRLTGVLLLTEVA